MKLFVTRILIAVTFIWLAGLLPATAQTGENTPAPLDTVIKIDRNQAPSDTAIKDRITGIFAELDGMDTLSVEVSQGVVSLSGTTASPELAEQALRLANRLSGVVTVQDNILRSLAVEDNVAPVLQGYRERFATFVEALPLIGLALLIVLFFFIFGSFLARRTKFWRRITPSPFLAEILSQAVRILLIVIGLVLALDLIGASALLTTILGGAGVLGIAIGFAIRDTMENYISSVMLSIRQPFRAKDHVVINDKEGIVVRLTSRATILMTLDGNHLRIPNAEVFKGTILNYSTNPQRRFSFKLGVDAEDDPVEAMKVGLDALRSHDFVLHDPTSGAFISDVGDSNIVIQFNGWVDQRETSFAKARSLSIRSVMRVLEDKGFTLPEPIYRVRFDQGISESIETGIGGKSKPKSATQKRKKPVTTQTSDAEILDVKPETDLQDKVEAEIRETEDADLLDKDQPQE